MGKPLGRDPHHLYREGRADIESGNTAAAIEKLKHSAELQPHFKTYEVLGEALMATGEYSEAVLYLAAAAGLGRRAFRARFLLAKALLALGPEWSHDAVQQLKEGLRDNPQYKSATKLLDQVLSQDKELD